MINSIGIRSLLRAYPLQRDMHQTVRFYCSILSLSPTQRRLHYGGERRPCTAYVTMHYVMLRGQGWRDTGKVGFLTRKLAGHCRHANVMSERINRKIANTPYDKYVVKLFEVAPFFRWDTQLQKFGSFFTVFFFSSKFKYEEINKLS